MVCAGMHSCFRPHACPLWPAQHAPSMSAPTTRLLSLSTEALQRQPAPAAATAAATAVAAAQQHQRQVPSMAAAVLAGVQCKCEERPSPPRRRTPAAPPPRPLRHPACLVSVKPLRTCGSVRAPWATPYSEACQADHGSGSAPCAASAAAVEAGQGDLRHARGSPPPHTWKWPKEPAPCTTTVSHSPVREAARPCTAACSTSCRGVSSACFAVMAAPPSLTIRRTRGAVAAAEGGPAPPPPAAAATVSG